MGAEVVTAQAQIGQLEKQLTEARATMEKYLRDYDTLYQRTQKLTEDLEEQILKNQQLHLENVSVEKEGKLRREEIVRLGTEKAQMERKVEREPGLRESRHPFHCARPNHAIPRHAGTFQFSTS